MSTDNAQRAGRHQPPARRPVRSWQEAERNAAAWMRHWGYHDAAARPGGADGGVDVRSARALGQVKFQAHAVGRPELQRLFGARGRHMDRQLLFLPAAATPRRPSSTPPRTTSRCSCTPSTAR
ncbi:restriction endonuclease [Streptomyces sp. MN13]